MTTHEITNQDIENLSTAAAQHGDLEQVAICERALSGDDFAAWVAECRERGEAWTRFADEAMTRDEAVAECARVLAR